MAVTAPQQASTTRLSYAGWFRVTLGGLALVIALNFLVAWRMDVFGLWRNPAGRSLRTAHHERKAKYLLNGAYVADNFDALIVGGSASVNWRLEDLTGYRFYNESLEGANAPEEKKLVDRALERGHFKVALVGLYPSITQTDAMNDGLERANAAEALGSLNLFDVEAEVLKNEWLHRRPENYVDGGHDLPDGPSFRPDSRVEAQPAVIIGFTPVALDAYRQTILRLQASGTRIVYVIYPIFDAYLKHNQQPFDDYFRQILPQLPPAPVIDFDAPEYTSFRSDPANYIDIIHLSGPGADRLSPLLNTRMHQALGDAR